MRIINKLIGAVLGATMAIGVGVGIWGGQKDITSVHAASDVSTTPSTTIEDGAKYVIAAGTSGTVFLSVTVTKGWGIATTIDSAAEFTAEGSGTSNFALKCSAGYLAPKTGGSSNNFLAYTSTTKALQLKNTNELFSNSNDNFNLRLNGTSGFRWYGNDKGPGTTGTAAKLYKIGGEDTPIEPPTPPELEHEGTLEDPFTPLEAISLCDYTGSGIIVGTDQQYYVKGVFDAGTTINTIYHQWYGMLDGTQFKISGATNDSGVVIEEVNGAMDGLEVIVKGFLELYNGEYKIGYLPASASPTGEKFIPSLVYVESKMSDDVSAWCTSFLATVTCDGGVTPPSTTAWEQMKTSFLELSSEDQLTLKTLNNDATARYDYIIAKYGRNTYEDFIGRNPAPLASSMRIFFNTPVQTTSFVVIIITTAIIGIVVGSWFVIKRKKKLD